MNPSHDILEGRSSMSIKRFIGNKQFYKNLLVISIPIILSQFISQFVNMLDSLMVGQLLTEEFTGVSIANQFLFIFNLAIFGAISGPSIFATQYHGANDLEGVKEAVRYKWVVAGIILVLGLLVFILFDDQLFNSFINDEEYSELDPVAVLNSGKTYLCIMLFGLPFFVLNEIYSSNLREAKQTLIPMIANIVAVGINLGLNYILIFGKLGAPRLGIKGVAIATVVARIIALLIVFIYSCIIKKYHFSNCIFKRLFPNKTSFKQILAKSYLLLLNEILWSSGMTLINYSFSLKGLEVVAAINIVSIFVNLFGLFGTSVGTGIAILIGQQLGASKFEEVRNDSYKYLVFSVFLGIIVAVVMFWLRNIIPSLYNMEPNVIEMATTLIAISAFTIPIRVYSVTCYFIIRSGGKVFITFLFDSAFTIAIRFPITFIFAKFTNIDIYGIYLISELLEIIKTIVGTVLVRKGIWIHNMTKKEG